MEEDDEDGSERKSAARVRLPGSLGQSSSLLNCESPGPSTGMNRYGLENASTVSIAGSMSSNRPRSPISSMGGEEGMSVTGNQSEAPSSTVAVNHLDARNSRSLPRNQVTLSIYLLILSHVMFAPFFLGDEVIVHLQLGSGGMCDTATPSEGNETQELAEADQSQG